MWQSQRTKERRAKTKTKKPKLVQPGLEPATTWFEVRCAAIAPSENCMSADAKICFTAVRTPRETLYEVHFRSTLTPFSSHFDPKVILSQVPKKISMLLTRRLAYARWPGSCFAAMCARVISVRWSPTCHYSKTLYRGICLE